LYAKRFATVNAGLLRIKSSSRIEGSAEAGLTIDNAVLKLQQRPPMSDNPYQSPRTASPFAAAKVAPPQADGVWRQGNLVVMHKNAPLPARCIKSNEPTALRLKRHLSWHPPWIFVLIIAGLLWYVIVALVMRKQATIHIGLSEDWMAHRRNRIIAAWMAALTGVLMFIGGIALIEPMEDAGVILMLTGIATFFIAIVAGATLSRMVQVSRMTDTHIWLRGCCSEFRNSLPELPPGV